MAFVPARARPGPGGPVSRGAVRTRSPSA